MGERTTISVAGQIIETVRSQPGAPAAYENGVAIGYGELARRADAHASALRALGDVSGLRVVVAGGHRLDTAIAMLGVLFAGAAFVVLDPADPIARRRDISERADPVAAIDVDGSLAELALELPVARVQDLNAAGGSDVGELSVADVEPDAPVWITFTSGTSGRPKGVLATNRSIMRPGVVDDSGYGPGVNTLVTGRLCWHGGVSQLMKAWMFGGALQLFDMVANGTDGLADTIDRLGVDRVFLVPTIARALFGSLPDDRVLGSLDHISFAGEQLWWRDLRLAAPHVRPDCTFGNGLASSETRAISRFRIAAADVADEDGPVPVGPVLERWQHRIVDEDGTPVGVGETGEIVVSSPNLFDGYWNDAELNERRFWFDDHGNRWFRTGDLVTRRADGMLVHAGRADFQLKLSGVLVAPQESEAMLASVDGVREVAVVGAAGPSTRPRMVAHVVVESDAVTSAGLHAVLREQLPEPLVPSEIRLRIEPLPRLGTGKIDRVLLSEQSAHDTGAGGRPRGEREEIIAAFFGQILGLDGVGRDDDFWDLGGDSLGAVELTTMIDDVFGVRLPVTTLVDHTSPVRLAGQVETASARPPGDLHWLTHGHGPTVVVAPGKSDTALRFRRMAHDLGDDQPVVVVEHAGTIRRERPSRTVEQAAERMERLIEPICDRPLVLLGHSYGAYVAYETARRMATAGQPPSLVILVDVRAEARPSRKGADHLRNWRDESPRTWLSTGVDGVRRRVRRKRRMAWATLAAGLDRPGTVRHHDLLGDVAVRAIARYRPGRYDGPVLVVRSSDRPDDDDPTMGWTALAPRTTVVELPGLHEYLPVQASFGGIVADAVASLAPARPVDPLTR